MTGHIRRFISLEETTGSFEQLFGEPGIKERVAHLTGPNREDALVNAYTSCVQKAGNFEYAASAIVLHPQINRTHFNLIYATRKPKGIEVFKEAEEKAMSVMDTVRGRAQKRTREQRTGQSELPFSEEDASVSAHLKRLRQRYTALAKASVQQKLEQNGWRLFSDLWATALSYPLTWENDLVDWIDEWKENGLVNFEGLKQAAKRTRPKLNANVKVVWLGKPKAK